MARRGWLAIAALSFLAAGAWVAFSAAGNGERPEGEWLDLPAADVPFRTLAGDEASLGDYAGRVVLLNFWGTWCPPCRREIPELVELQETLAGSGATVIGIAVESGSPEEVARFAREFGINYPIWLSDARTALAHYDALGYPFTLLIDASGTIRKQYIGPQSAEVLLRDMRAFTGEEAPARARG